MSAESSACSSGAIDTWLAILPKVDDVHHGSVNALHKMLHRKDASPTERAFITGALQQRIARGKPDRTHSPRTHPTTAWTR